MDFVILGLLILKEMTVYEIKTILEKNISLFYSASFGSINSAVKKLFNDGSIIFNETTENGRNKKIYQITEKGKNDFNNLLIIDADKEKIKDKGLTRLFFLGLFQKEEQINFIKKIISDYTKMKESLTLLFQEYKNSEYESNKKEIVQYQFYTLQYGIDYYQFNIEWYKKTLNEIQSN